MDLLTLDPTEFCDDSMEVSDEATDALLSFNEDEESEMTLSEVSGLSSSKAVYNSASNSYACHATSGS